MRKIKNNIIILVILAIISVFIVMQSPLNPIATSRIGTDSSVFIYGGNQIREGKVLYKDFFDHKGPFLYVIEALGLSLSNGSTLGIWILELFFMFSNLCAFYKISRLYSKNKIINLISVAISIIPISHFFESGNLVEEYALSFISWSLYIFLEFMRNRSVSYKKIFISGICLSIVILLRPNMISLWLTYIPIVIFMYIHDKKIKNLMFTTLSFLAGMLTIMLPTILYFVINNAFNDFIYSFLHFNILYTKYGNSSLNYLSVLSFFFWRARLNIFILIVLILDIIIRKIKKQKCKEQLSIILYFILTLLLICISRREYPHYGIILIPCYIVPITLILEHIIDIKLKYLRIFLIIILTLLILYLIKPSLIALRSNMRETIRMFISPVAEYVKENSDEQSNVLILGNNCFVYGLSNRKYQGKYFYQSPIVKVDNKLYIEFMNELENNKPDLIIYPYIYKNFNIEKKINNNFSKILENIEIMEKENIYIREESQDFISWKLKK